MEAARKALRAAQGDHCKPQVPDNASTLAYVLNRVTFLLKRGRTGVASTSLTLRLNAFTAAAQLLKERVAHHKGFKFRGAAMLVRTVSFLRWAKGQHLHSPSKRQLQRRLCKKTAFWHVLKNGPRDPAAFFLYTGLTVDDFKLLAKYFETPPSNGRPSRLDAEDKLAMVMRWMLTVGTRKDVLYRDFACGPAVVSRTLEPAIKTLLAALKTLPDAQCRYPSLEEGRLMEAGARAQFGEPPEEFDYDGSMCVMVDGTVTPVFCTGNDEKQKLFAYRHHFHAYNSNLVFDLWGRICAYIVCAPGTAHDSRVSAPLFERHADPKVNPHKHIMVVDNGYKRHTNDGRNGLPGVFRPLGNEKVPTALRDSWKAWSKYVTTRRQPNEWGNGVLKRAYPRICVPMRLDQREMYTDIFELAIHLNNWRTRRVGFNQCQTVFRRHTDARWRSLLLKSKQSGGQGGLDYYLRMMRADVHRRGGRVQYPAPEPEAWYDWDGGVHDPGFAAPGASVPAAVQPAVGAKRTRSPSVSKDADSDSSDGEYVALVKRKVDQYRAKKGGGRMRG